MLIILLKQNVKKQEKSITNNLIMIHFNFSKL